MDTHINLQSSIYDHEASEQAKKQEEEILRSADPNEDQGELDDLEASAEAVVHGDKMTSLEEGWGGGQGQGCNDDGDDDKGCEGWL